MSALQPQHAPAASAAAKAPPFATAPVLTPAGAAATGASWRHGVTRTGEDARRAAKPDVATPFASLEDAVSRLLPYHVFGTEEGDEADVDEASARPEKPTCTHARTHAQHTRCFALASLV
jgi:hypothetical protein